MRSRWRRARARWSVTTPPTRASVSTRRSSSRSTYPLILGFFTPVVWRCPTTPSPRGGVSAAPWQAGTRRRSRYGLSLDRAEHRRIGTTRHAPRPRICVASVASTSRRIDGAWSIRPSRPTSQPLATGRSTPRRVLHCLPGPLPRKAAAVANVAAVLAPTGVLFGASILGRSGRHTWLARRLLEANNRRGTFDNLGDTAGGPRRDPRGIVRAGGAGDCRLDGHLLGHESAHEVAVEPQSA